MSDPQAFTAQQAADPATPAQTLADIAAQRPDLRAALASNPSTYQALLDWLGELGDPDVDAALAARGGGSPAAPVQPATPQQPEPVDQGWSQPAPGQDQPGAGWQPATDAQPGPVEPDQAAPGLQPAPAQPWQSQTGGQPAPAQPWQSQAGDQPQPAQPWQPQPGGQPGPAQPWQQGPGQPQPDVWQPGGPPPGQQWQGYGAPPPKKSNTALIVVLVVVGVLIVLGIGGFLAVRALGNRISDQVVGEASISYATTGNPQDPPPGDDPTLDALWLACQAEDWGACDQLYDDSPIDSAYEAYGGTCGFRTDGQSYCTDQFGG